MRTVLTSSHQAKRIVESLGAEAADPWVVAVIATESSFRTAGRRMCELVAWIVLHWAWRTRVEKLSVGLAQVQLRHWVRLGVLTDLRPSLKSFQTVTSLSANYHVVDAYLEAALTAAHWNEQSITLAYVGRAKGFYAKVLRSARDAAADAILQSDTISRLRRRRARPPKS